MIQVVGVTLRDLAIGHVQSGVGALDAKLAVYGQFDNLCAYFDLYIVCLVSGIALFMQFD